MASRQKQSQRSASPARRRQRQPKQQPQPTFERELEIAGGHLQALEAQRAQLEAQKKRVEDQIKDIENRLNQTVGRIETLQELRHEIAPLPPVGIGQPAPIPPSVTDASPNGSDPEEEQLGEGAGKD